MKNAGAAPQWMHSVWLRAIFQKDLLGGLLAGALLLSPALAVAGEPTWWTQMKAACISSGGHPVSEYYNDWVAGGGCVCPGSTTGSGRPTCAGSTSSALGPVSGNLMQQSTQAITQGLMHGNAGLVGLGVFGSMLSGALTVNPQEVAARRAQAAAQEAADRAAAAQAAARAAAQAAAQQRRMEATKEQLLGENKNPGAPGQLSLMGVTAAPDLQLTSDSAAPNLQLMSGEEVAPSQTAVRVGVAPSALDTPDDLIPAVVGPALNADMPAVIPTPTASEYMDRAGHYLIDRAQELSGDAVRAEGVVADSNGFVADASGLSGIEGSLLINEFRLPNYILPKVLAAGRGDLSAEEGGELLGKSVNRLVDIGSPVNAVIENGVQDTARENLTEGVASVTASFLPGTAEMRENLAETAPALAEDWKHVVTLWTVPTDH